MCIRDRSSVQSSPSLNTAVFTSLFVGSLLSSGKLVELYTSKTSSPLDTWAKNSILLIFIFVVYDIVISGSVVKIISQYKDSQATEILASLSDLARFGTVLSVNHLALSYINNKPYTNTEVMYKIIGIILGYSLYNMSASYMLNVGPKYQPFYNDFMKVSMGDIFGSLLVKGANLDTSDLYVVLADFIAMAVFHFGLKPLVGISPEKSGSAVPDAFLQKRL
jgi:hypothetical protein